MPEGYEDSAKKENKVLLTFERIGEVLTCVIVLVFSDFNPRKTIWVTWLVISFAFMILYEIYWIRYFKSEHTMMDMYSSLFGIPVAGATLPIISFVFLGIYGSNVFLLVSVIILGIGHIGIHLQHRLFPWKKPICIVTGMHIQRHKQTEKIHQNLKKHINNMKAIRILLIL